MKSYLYFTTFLLLFATALNHVYASRQGDLNMETFANLSYHDIYDHPIMLVNGVYEGAPFVPEGAARPRVQIAKTLFTLSDLDQDGEQDAAVLLTESSGGSGENNYLAIVSRQDGRLTNITTRLIGDRIQIISLRSQRDQLLLEFVTTGPGEPLCCPTLKLRNTYRLENGKLIEVSSERLGQLTLADLEGVNWRLSRFGRNELVPEDLVITAVFKSGKVTGSAGCNRYFADLKGISPKEISIGLAGTTRMGCPKPVMTMEDRYLSTLQSVNRFIFVLGELALIYQNGQTLGMMLFTREQR